MNKAFPDRTPINNWFNENNNINNSSLKRYIITDYGIKNDGNLYTKEFQSLIDNISNKGGGIIVIPEGTFLTGALFIKENVHLLIEEKAVLKGSDDINDYPIINTRIEGESGLYFSALINVDSWDGFTLAGQGTIDGNGLKSWKAFWLRRQWNPECTNKDEQRARLIYLSNCNDITFYNIRLQNAQFWTSHFYKCNNIKILNCSFYSPKEPVKAPSTDAIDLDGCHNVLIKGCDIEVNDDGVALKGGKGPYSDSDPNNRSNENIIIEDCHYGFCHGCLTLGSEAIHCRNIILRNCIVEDGFNVLWLKMRPDTPQLYEYVTVDNLKGRSTNFIQITPWTQFFDLKGRDSIPLSYAKHITMSNCSFICHTGYFIKEDDSQYKLESLSFINNEITEE